jgi:hypothetical protein
LDRITVEPPRRIAEAATKSNPAILYGQQRYLTANAIAYPLDLNQDARSERYGNFLYACDESLAISNPAPICFATTHLGVIAIDGLITNPSEVFTVSGPRPVSLESDAEFYGLVVTGEQRRILYTGPIEALANTVSYCVRGGHLGTLRVAHRRISSTEARSRALAALVRAETRRADAAEAEAKFLAPFLEHLEESFDE